jgi:hypothetical protein
MVDGGGYSRAESRHCQCANGRGGWVRVQGGDTDAHRRLSSNNRNGLVDS